MVDGWLGHERTGKQSEIDLNPKKKFRNKKINQVTKDVGPSAAAQLKLVKFSGKGGILTRGGDQERSILAKTPCGRGPTDEGVGKKTGCPQRSFHKRGSGLAVRRTTRSTRQEEVRLGHWRQRGI